MACQYTGRVPRKYGRRRRQTPKHPRLIPRGSDPCSWMAGDAPRGVGAFVGAFVGARVGLAVGTGVGTAVGDFVWDGDGGGVGTGVGCGVGTRITHAEEPSIESRPAGHVKHVVLPNVAKYSLRCFAL